ncbi:MAG TPA: phosphopyruvate hydratase [Candidatus Saccharimonadales bacterium]|nr:phosphopyruvate hydratase [Candidatus Saccharimonadales bacterium]
MSKIRKITAREILDSRGIPTLESIIELEDSSVGIYSVPSGTSVGKYEAHELRDGDQNRYGGQGVLKCLEKISSVLSPQLIGKDAKNQQSIDQIMLDLDGTHTKENLGANSLLCLSAAIAKAQANSQKQPLYQYISTLFGSTQTQFTLPTPMFNVLNGGMHANHNLDFQEFMIVPSQAGSYSKNLKLGVECYHALKETLKSHSASVLIGDEGGYAPLLYSNMDAFKMLEEAVAKANYRIGLDAFFSLDAAASYIKQGDTYRIKDKPTPLSATDLIDFYISLNEQYHLLALEDPLDQDDWDSWKVLYSKLGNDTLIVADDLTCTNTERLNKAIEQKCTNAIVVKPNQVGTITQTLEAVRVAKDAGFKIVVSHRSGETNDDFIVDFAVACGADYAKFGAPARGERVAKYNRLLEIEHELS